MTTNYFKILIVGMLLNLIVFISNSQEVWTNVSGAFGDGIHNDYDSIQAKIITGKLVSLSPNKTYLIRDRLRIGPNQTLYIPTSSTIIFDHTSFSWGAIELWSNYNRPGGGTIMGDGKIQLKRPMPGFESYNIWNWETSKCGIMVLGHECKIDIGTIEGFEYGIYMYSSVDSMGCSNNNIKVRNMYDCVVGVKMERSGGTSEHAGFINQNYIHIDKMMECRTSSYQKDPWLEFEYLIAMWNNNSTGIAMYSDGNANTFSGGIEYYNIGILLKGKHNRIQGLRLESCTTTIRIEGNVPTVTMGNYLFGEYDHLLTERIVGINLGTGKTWRDALQIYGLGDDNYFKNVDISGILSPLTLPITTVTTNITLSNIHYTILANAVNITISLPPANSCFGRIYVIKKITSTAGNITIDGYGSETIDGTTTKALSTQYQKLAIQSNGTSWFIIN